MNDYCIPFSTSIYQCACEFFQKNQIMLVEHISKIRSENFPPEYQAEIAQSNNKLMGDQEHLGRCYHDFKKLNEAYGFFSSSGTIIDMHKQMLITLITKCQEFHGAQVDIMDKGRMLASRILNNLGIVAGDGNDDFSSAMGSMSLDD